MKAIKPLSITDAMLTSSNVTEDDYDEFSMVTTYAAGDYVMETASGVHKVYESLRDNNIGKYPPDSLTGSDPWWLETSPTNRWKMFDTSVQTQTVNTKYIEVVITPGIAVDSFALLNMDAAKVTVTMTDPVAGEVYRVVIIMEATEVVVWETGTVWQTVTYGDYEWQGGSYNDLVENTPLRTDLPSYPNAYLTFVIVSSGTLVECGVCLIGNVTSLGTTQYSPALSILDYSIKDVDSWGNYYVLERTFSKKASCTFFLDTADHGRIYRFLAHYRATPLLWIVSEDYNATIVYGFYKEFSITIPNLIQSICDISIEGLT